MAMKPIIEAGWDAMDGITPLGTGGLPPGAVTPGLNFGCGGLPPRPPGGGGGGGGGNVLVVCNEILSIPVVQD